jgi:serine phosphatase RsbU (regulator of sigma subunit)
MDAPNLNDLLREQYDRAEATHALAQRVQRLGLPSRLPPVGAVRFAVAVAPNGWFDVVRLDEAHVAFWVAEPGHTMTGTLVGLALRQVVVGREVTEAGARLVPPSEVVARVNRAILDLDAPAPVGFGYGLIDVETGAVAFARGGVPPPVQFRDGKAEVWHGPAPFLGAFDAEFPPHEGRLGPGEWLIVASVGDVTRLTDAGSPQAVQAALADEDLTPTALVIER